MIHTGGHSALVDWWSFGIFIHELLYGTTPFFGIERPETLENICYAPLSFSPQPQTSAACKDLITKLLSKKPMSRLGSLKGTEEIKLEHFFSRTNWALLREK